MALNLVRQDDLDQSSPAQPVRFGWGGKNYEIDLSSDNLAKFEEQMAPYVAAAREVGTEAHHVAPSDIRAWARERRLHVPARGKIPQHIRDQFEREFQPGPERLAEHSDGEIEILQEAGGSELPEVTQDDLDTAHRFYGKLSPAAIKNLSEAAKNSGPFPPDPNPKTQASIAGLERKGFAAGGRITGAGLAALALLDAERG
ncbi:Lsr2 family protein [Kitasatospora sp. NPDC052896]|uniref:Lsr2 family protein n=1 Tax=Kitasatospora sp. NPDC052896 TaxID=3364061 RepID=UPI0037C8431B